MAEIHKIAFPEDPWDEDAFVVLLGQPGVAGLIDEAGGMVLLRNAADEAEILTIGVTKPGEGLGRRLLHAAIAIARDGGAAAMFLEVAGDNARALALYYGAGFVLAGKRLGYYGAGRDALVLQLTL